MIYRLRADRFNFLVGDISFDEVKAKTGDYFTLDTPLWTEIWKPMAISFRDDSDEQNVLTPPDITCWLTDNIFLNQKVYDNLGTILATSGELLPCYCEGIPYWVLHVTQKTGLDAVNLSHSRRTIEHGGYINVESLEFYEAKLTGLYIFTTEFSGYRNIYCTEQFKSLVESAGLQGLIFSSDLAGVDEP